MLFAFLSGCVKVKETEDSSFARVAENPSRTDYADSFLPSKLLLHSSSATAVFSNATDSFSVLHPVMDLFLMSLWLM